MANISPLKKYLAAVDAQRRGDRAAAATLLASAMGATKATPVITNSIDRLLQPDSLPNDVTLTILASEISRRKR